VDVTAAAPPRTVVHVARTGESPPLAALADRDWLVYLEPLRLAAHGQPPYSPGPIDHDQLVALVFAADLVITW
jgi:hypothetical protein